MISLWTAKPRAESSYRPVMLTHSPRPSLGSLVTLRYAGCWANMRVTGSSIFEGNSGTAATGRPARGMSCITVKCYGDSLLDSRASVYTGVSAN
jgi:hypothetical protein